MNTSFSKIIPKQVDPCYCTWTTLCMSFHKRVITLPEASNFSQNTWVSRAHSNVYVFSFFYILQQHPQSSSHFLFIEYNGNPRKGLTTKSITSYCVFYWLCYTRIITQVVWDLWIFIFVQDHMEGDLPSSLKSQIEPCGHTYAQSTKQKMSKQYWNYFKLVLVITSRYLEEELIFHCVRSFLSQIELFQLKNKSVSKIMSPEKYLISQRPHITW